LMSTLTEKNIEVLLTMGAGDIDVFVQPIKAQLLKRSHPLKGDKEGCL